jgi:hypothetical protein
MALIRLALGLSYHVWRNPARQYARDALRGFIHNCPQQSWLGAETRGTRPDGNSFWLQFRCGGPSMSSVILQASLPRRFPVGAVYVVEGTGGGYGHLRVSSRYVILPGGRRIDVAADPDRAGSTRAMRRHQLRNALQDHGKNRPRRGGPKASVASPKKFRIVGGTDR